MRRSRSIDQRRRSAGVGFNRISLARWCRDVRCSLTLPLGSAERVPPSPVKGEGLFIPDLPRLARLVERDEGEFAFRYGGFLLAVALAGDGFGFEAQRGAALLQELDIDAELVADRHRAGEFDCVRGDQDRLALCPARGEGAAGEAHL